MVVFILIASVSGLVAGYLLGVLRLNQLMVVIYHLPFRFWKPYLVLYDALENKYTYELLGGEKRFGSHAKFLKQYHSFRPEATKQFKKLWGLYARKVGRDYVLVLIIGLALFWGVWWAFIGSFAAMQIFVFLWVRYARQNKADMYVSSVVSIIFSRN